MSSKAESIEVGTIEVKVVPSLGAPEKATLLVVQPQKSCMPIMFERSARTFWNPQFDSSQLEIYHQKISMQQTLRIFQYALGYVALSCLAWSIYVGFQPRYLNSWVYFLAGLLVLFLMTLGIFLLSCTKIYTQQKLLMSVLLTLILCTSSLLYYVFATNADMSLIGIFIGSVEIITLLYTFIPMPLYFCMIIGVTYSVVFETFSAVLTPMSDWRLVVGRLLLHAAVHFLGVHLFVISQVRQRSTFLKVGQSIQSRKDLQIEKQFKQDMIHSLMPPKVAQEVMSSRDTKGNPNDEDGSKKLPNMSGAAAMTFRSFHMSKMENVSILFADIVGFTKMSSNKSAEHLVSLLSDLFGRFDDICCKCGCEKISTLGDCYYCVSGCPEPRADHARCCVEMGLSMCIAIKQFDEDHKEEVNMRVGVHTGTVLCGLVGTRRFKFDVWSHDVTIANMMESEGKPGCVHISDHTYKFVEEDYDVEKGESVPDIRGHKTLIECFDSGTQQYIVQHVAKESSIDTWFIVDRKPHVVPLVPDAYLQVPKATLDSQKNEANDLALDLEENDKKTPSAHLLPGSSNSKDLNDSSVISAHLLPLDGSKTKQSDTEMIECMESCNELQTYLYRPPINRFTLNYTDPVLENKYRRHCLDDITSSSASEGPKTQRTRALPNITNLFDLTLALVFFAVVAIACVVVLPVGIAFWIVLSLALLVQLLFLVCAVLESYPNKFCGSGFLKVLNRAFLGWLPRHVIHILVAALPACLVYSAFSCSMGVDHGPLQVPSPASPLDVSVTTASDVPLPYPYNLSELFFCMVLIVSLLHFCNFTLLSSWFKFLVVSLVGVVLLILVHSSICTVDSGEGISPLSETFSFLESNASRPAKAFARLPQGNLSTYWSLFSWTNRPPTLAFEMILVVLLLLLLIAFINYDVEVGYRLCYHGDVQVAKDKQKILKEKEQADWLLHIIVPEHVADQLKHNRHYCENHKDVGVIFAKISNFDDFYDESYEGGKEYLRVLNELMGDFEELFDLPQFKDVEKIKTIGSCLMAASGLDPRTRKQNKDPDAHLYALIDFAVAIVHKVEAFNRDIFNFNFELKIGFNAGEVTAGVIGTQKLLYDIWGDTVNIASRMYSTGVHDRIQITEAFAKRLEPKFDFEYRGQTFVKGKGDMNTYLLVGKKKGATWS